MATITRVDDTTTEFAEGTLTDVQAENNSLKLAYSPVLNFDGVDDYVTIPSFDNSANLTVEMWVGFNSLNDNWLISKRDVNTHEQWQIIHYNGALGAYIFAGTSNSVIGEVLYSSISAGQKYHIAFTTNGVSGGFVNLYVDGAEVGTASLSSDMHLYTLDTIIGARPWSLSKGNHDGFIDDIRIWDTVRTQQEIQNNMHKKLTGSETGLIAYYKMNEGNGTTIIDSAGTNNGTIYGATWVNNTYYKFSGNRVTPQLNINFTSISSSLISWTETLNTQTITIETRTSTDGGSTWTAWTQVTNGGSIPDLSPGCLLECRQNLSTTDIATTPELNSLTIEVNGFEYTLMLGMNF